MKKPSRAIRVSTVLIQFAMSQAGLTTAESSAKLFEFSGIFLYEKEVEKVIAEKEGDEDFNAEAFVSYLAETKAIKKSSGTSGNGQRVTTINSMERALQVANNPDDAQQIIDIINAVIKLREELKPLISEHAELSIALKNKKAKEPVQETEEYGEETAEDFV